MKFDHIESELDLTENYTLDELSKIYNELTGENIPPKNISPKKVWKIISELTTLPNKYILII